MKLIIFTFLLSLSTVYSGELPCSCRLGNLKRVVNGKIASINSIPWIVSLSNVLNTHFCGGAILNENYILTAAHCTNEYIPEGIIARVGLHDIENVNKSRIHYGKKVISAGFENPGDFGDFALIELKTPIEFVPGEVEPACLNLKDTDFDDDDLLSAGWGLTARPWRKIIPDSEFGSGNTYYPSEDSTVLKYYFGRETFTVCREHDICIKPYNEGDSSCNGDSGGPLMHVKKGKASVVGIASSTSAEYEDDKIYFCNGKAAFARLSLYKDLIDENVVNYCSIKL